MRNFTTILTLHPSIKVCWVDTSWFICIRYSGHVLYRNNLEMYLPGQSRPPLSDQVTLSDVSRVSPSPSGGTRTSGVIRLDWEYISAHNEELAALKWLDWVMSCPPGALRDAGTDTVWCWPCPALTTRMTVTMVTMPPESRSSDRAGSSSLLNTITPVLAILALLGTIAALSTNTW